jgi:hypothetical protein
MIGGVIGSYAEADELGSRQCRGSTEPQENMRSGWACRAPYATPRTRWWLKAAGGGGRSGEVRAGAAPTADRESKTEKMVYRRGAEEGA